MPKVGRKEVKEVGCGIAADWNHPLLHLARFIGRSGHWRTTIVWLRSKNHVRGCRTCSWTSLCADSLAANSPTGSNNICDPKSIFTLPRLSFADTRRATKNLNCPPPAFPAEVGQSDALPSFFFFFFSALLLQTSVLFVVHFMLHFWLLCVLCCWFRRLKLPPSIKAMYDVPCGENMCVREVLSRHDQHMLNKVSLKRNTHSTRLCTD